MTTLNTTIILQMLENGTKYIEYNYEHIDDLNVFPVPDGDTGTNLKITTSGAWEALENLQINDVYEILKTYARGLLMNARGNSGVIFSQIFKGFSMAFHEKQTEATITDLIDAFNKAKEYAYKSVTTPIEGTILTVIRVVAQKLIENNGKFSSIEDFFKFVYDEAKIILDQTPNFLMQLKEVGVVDSGGYGLVCFLEGMKDAILNPNIKKPAIQHTEVTKTIKINKNFIDDNNGFGYCTEFIMKIGSRVTTEQKGKEKYNEENFKQTIKSMGNSFVYVRDDNIVKVHIHVIEPYKVLAYASRFGEFNRVKIENMTLQFMMHNKNTSLEELEKTYNDNNKITSQTKIAVTVPSENLKKVYENEFGITNCLNCEKIGNPTIQQFYDLIKSAKSKNVILITDNSNTLLAAEQAIKLFPKQAYNIKLLPCKDIAASYLTCLSFNPELDNHDVVFKEMNKVFKSISTAKISKSIKNIKYKNLNIKFGDTIGVYNKEIIVNSRNENIVSKTLINHLFSHCKAKNTVVIIYGKDATMQQVDNMVKYISQTYLIKPIIVPGNQPTYQYYIGTAR